jgi:twitching motility two-component system response regulator PilG
MNSKTAEPPLRTLQEAVRTGFSGQVLVSDPQDKSVTWRIYASGSNIHFANSVAGQQERTIYLLQQYHPDLELLAWPTDQSDYQYVCRYWQSNRLNFQQIRHLLSLLTVEALVHVAAIPEAQTSLQAGVGLEPMLLSLALKDTVLSVRSQIQTWSRLRTAVQSPFQRPTVDDLALFYQTLLHQKDETQIKALDQAFSRNITLYEAAREVGLDVLAIAQLLAPLTQNGVVSLKPFRKAKQGLFKVVCVDDSPTILNEISRFLNANEERFSVFTIDDPVKALVQVARIQPDIVLLDVGMPNVNGYELCRMLRNHPRFKDTPIIMVTGNTGLIDRAKAKLCGASDYLTKPFTQEGLVDIVSRHLLQ